MFDATNQWIFLTWVVPFLFLGLTAGLSFFVYAVELHVLSIFFVQRPPCLRRSAVISSKIVVVQVGLAVFFAILFVWSFQNGHSTGAMSIPEFDLVMSSCGASCGVEGLNAYSYASNAETQAFFARQIHL